MKKLDRVRVGIVGLGMVSYSHIDAYAANENAEVAAVCDLNEQQCRAVCEKYGIRKYYTDYAEMLKDPEINTIDITTPTFLHARMTIQAANAGKNISCEKPFCLTLEEGRAAVEAARRNDVSLMVGESYVFMSTLEKARELIDAGEIGKPTQMRQRFGAWIERDAVMDNRPVSANREWRMDSSKAGGSGFPWMFDHCVHFFSAAEYLMNDARVKEVFALKADLGFMQARRDEHAVDGSRMHLYGTNRAGDIPIMTWTYEDPACAGVWMRGEYLNGKFDKYTGFSLSVLGDDGMIELLGEGGKGLESGGQSAHLVLTKKDGSVQTYRFDEGGDEIWDSEVSYYSRAHKNQIDSFVDSLIHGRQPRYDGEKGLYAVQTTMAAICSAKEGRPVRVCEVTDERVAGSSES
ncbi:MAG: Gfo/Idh/MocA family protein [Aristaeellaceae bacterium]